MMPTVTGAPIPEPRQLRLGTLLQVFFRSFFLQASWNPRGMQNLGLAYALFPALQRLYPAREAQTAAVRRHLAFFNTHPYVAAAIVGGVLFHEERIARGEEPPETVVAFKAALMGPLAALGDGFFWLSLRPAVGAFCAALVPWLGGWAVVVFLIAYNLVHLTFRARLYVMGLTLGDRLIEGISRANLPARGAKLRTVAAASAGGLAAWLAVDFGSRAASSAALWLTLGCLLMGVGAYHLVGWKRSPYVALYVVAGLAGLAGALL